MIEAHELTKITVTSHGCTSRWSADAGMVDDRDMPGRRFPDMWVDPEDDPREGGPSLGDERTTLVEFLRTQRLTLELKCADLDAADLARRSVEPSTLSLLGLVRHMAEVERSWFRRRMAGQDAPPRYYSPSDPDGDFEVLWPTPQWSTMHGRPGVRRSRSPSNSSPTHPTSASSAIRHGTDRFRYVSCWST